MYYHVCRMVHIKYILLLNKNCSHVVVTVGFLSRYLNSSLSYVLHHITVNKMCFEGTVK